MRAIHFLMYGPWVSSPSQDHKASPARRGFIYYGWIKGQSFNWSFPARPYVELLSAGLLPCLPGYIAFIGPSLPPTDPHTFRSWKGNPDNHGSKLTVPVSRDHYPGSRTAHRPEQASSYVQLHAEDYCRKCSRILHQVQQGFIRVIKFVITFLQCC